MHFLLTNDDGIAAPGLKELFRSIAPSSSKITIAAPAKPHSGAGLSTNYVDALKMEKVAWEGADAYAVHSTPADCIKSALGIFLKDHPNMILSGINHGTNAGRNVLYSGTVGGVIEGILRGIPGIAFSFPEESHTSFPDIKHLIAPLVQYFVDHPLPPGTLLNVNFPAIEPKGFRLSRQGLCYHLEDPLETHTDHYLMRGKWVDFDEPEDSDTKLLKQGYITCTPLHVNELTDHTVLATRRDHFEKALKKNYPFLNNLPS